VLFTFVVSQRVSRNAAAVGGRVPGLRRSAPRKERNGPPKLWTLGYVGGPNALPAYPSFPRAIFKCEGLVKTASFVGLVQTQVTAQGGWGRRENGAAARSDVDALGAR
jgi:hypothetical protein